MLYVLLSIHSLLILSFQLRRVVFADKHQPPGFQSSLLWALVVPMHQSKTLGTILNRGSNLLRSSRIIYVKEQDLSKKNVVWRRLDGQTTMVLGYGPQVTVIETRWCTVAGYRE